MLCRKPVHNRMRRPGASALPGSVAVICQTRRMPRGIRLVQFVFQAAIVGLALAFIATRLWPSKFGGGEAAASAGKQMQNSYAPAVAHAVPAVVNIYTGRIVEQR